MLVLKKSDYSEELLAISSWGNEAYIQNYNYIYEKYVDILVIEKITELKMYLHRFDIVNLEFSNVYEIDKQP